MHRGEVWLVEYEPSSPPGEPARTRPAIIVSSDRFNRTRSGSVAAVPLTTTARGHPMHVEIDGSGTSAVSYAQVEMVGPVARKRMLHRIGSVGPATLAEVSTLLTVFLDLG